MTDLRKLAGEPRLAGRRPGAGPDARSDSRLAVRSALGGVALLTVVIALMPVAHALYLMLLLDVARPGRSGETMLGLLALTVVVTALHVALLALRRRVLADLAVLLDDTMIDGSSPLSAEREDGCTVRDGDPVRAALAGGGAAALIDAAAVPLLLAVLLLIAGTAALVPLSGVVVSALLLAGSSRPLARAHQAAGSAMRQRDGQAETVREERQALALLGMTGIATMAVKGRARGAAQRQRDAVRRAAALGHRTALVCGLAGAVTATLAAWRMANDAMSLGGFAATLLLTGFVLLPLHGLAAHWGVLAAGYGQWRRFRTIMAEPISPGVPVALPPPRTRIDVVEAALLIPDTRRLLLQDISFAAEAGDVVAVIGPAAIGKSALLALLAGVLRPAAGAVRLDGATLDQWDAAARMRHIGYLPQVPMLFAGTVAQNIARFEPAAASGAVTAAAMAAGAHDMIVRLPAGYDTMVGPAAPVPLPVSIQQRIALARALFGDPFLLLLDQPASFQDAEGQRALRLCLTRSRQRGAVTIVVGDSAPIVESANLVLMLRAGGMIDFGPKDAVRTRLAERQRRDADRLARGTIHADPSVTSPAPVEE